MSQNFSRDRRDFVKLGAAAATAATFPMLSAQTASAARAKRQLGLVGVDHVGLTVPDVGEAVAWFKDVMGAVSPLAFGPISDPKGPLMRNLLGVDERAVIKEVAVVRIGHSANIELFEYKAPGQRRDHPRNSDFTGHHIAFYVTDIDAAVAYMDAKGVERFFGPFGITDGPAAGQTVNYFKTPFGTYIELISYPKGMAYEAGAQKPLWSPKRNGTKAGVTSVPGLLGIDHVGITVRDVKAATTWFKHVLGGSNPLTFGPFADPTGDFIHDLVDTDPRAVVEQIRVVRLGDGPGVELFQYTAPDQDRKPRRNSDWGAHHVAVYVEDLERAIEVVKARGGHPRLGPFPVTDGPAAGQAITYVRTPFGTDVELISYPEGMAYAAKARTDLWDPRDNKS